MRKVVLLTCVALILPPITNAHHTPAHNKKVIRKVFGPNAEAALRVAGCETGWTYATWSTGAEGERGLFQIHPTWRYKINWRLAYLPRVNVRFAYWLSKGGTDWSNWTCKP